MEKWGEMGENGGKWGEMVGNGENWNHKQECTTNWAIQHIFNHGAGTVPLKQNDT